MPSGLSSFIIEIVANAIFELIVIRATCKLLDIRKPIAYGAAVYVLMLASFVLNATDSAGTLPKLLIGLLSTFIIPIALSNKPLSSRFLRTLLIVASLSAAELIAQLVFSVSSGVGNYPKEPSQAPTIPAAITYVVSVYMAAVMLEILIMVCGRSNQQINLAIELPVILLNVCSYIAAFTFSTRIARTNTNSSPLATITLGVVLGALLISLGALEIAQRDIAAAKENADRVALTRQVRHIKAELRIMARHSTRVRQLRHDLANQMGTVNELLRCGQTEVASLYLTQLQTRAKHLIEGKVDHEQDCPSTWGG